MLISILPHHSIGAICAESLKTGAEAYGLNLMTNFGGATVDEANDLIKGVVNAVLNPKEHVYYLTLVPSKPLGGMSCADKAACVVGTLRLVSRSKWTVAKRMTRAWYGVLIGDDARG